MGSVFRQAGRKNWMIKYYRDGRAIVESSRTDDKNFLAGSAHSNTRAPSVAICSRGTTTRTITAA